MERPRERIQVVDSFHSFKIQMIPTIPVLLLAHLIKESELMALKSKTFRHMRLRELLLQHSITSNLIVM